MATSRCAKQEQTPPLELHVTQDLRPRGSPAHHMEGHARHDGREDVYVQLGVDLRAVPAPPPRRALMPDVRGGCRLRAGPHCIAQRGRSAASPRSPSPPAAAAWVPAPGAMPALLVIGTRARPRYSPRPVLVCRTSCVQGATMWGPGAELSNAALSSAGAWRAWLHCTSSCLGAPQARRAPASSDERNRRKNELMPPVARSAVALQPGHRWAARVPHQARSAALVLPPLTRIAASVRVDSGPID